MQAKDQDIYDQARLLFRRGASELRGSTNLISPNPVGAGATLWIEGREDFSGELNIYDVTGRLIARLHFKNLRNSRRLRVKKLCLGISTTIRRG